tara:strand:+ start:53 stop:379 length:327 start_codon:yes stop_codon:yes gene_type:complete
MIKLTKLEIETITDRPEDCIVEHLELYYPKQNVEDAVINLYHFINKNKALPDDLSNLDKEILDNCMSQGTWDRAEDEGQPFWGQVKRAVRSIEKKFAQAQIPLSCNLL